jgi:hypothetical protein
LARHANLERWTLERTVASYSGRLRVRYEEALRSLGNDELSDFDAKLSGFLKGEKFNPVVKCAKPRLINPRNPRFNLVLASYLKPLEHMLWSKWVYGHGCPKSRVSAKGLNMVRRANLIRRKMEEVGDCIVFEVDGKAFEAHVGSEQLRLEHAVYKAAYPKDRTLCWLLEKQLHLVGKTNHGWKYRRDGCRASGDFNTGLGNTILMGTFTIAALETLTDATSRWTVMADGDNCLIFIDRHSATRVHGLFAEAIASVSSHEVTLERPTDTIEEVTFGQSQPVLTDRGYVMVRDVYKVLSGAFSGYRHYGEARFAPRLVKAVAQAEGALACGVPLLQPYFAEVLRVCQGYKDLSRPDLFLEGHLLHVPTYAVAPIGQRTRLSFERAFGIGPAEQVSMEARLVALVRDQLPAVLAGGSWLKRVVEVGCGPLGDRDESDMDWLC